MFAKRTQDAQSAFVSFHAPNDRSWIVYKHDRSDKGERVASFKVDEQSLIEMEELRIAEVRARQERATEAVRVAEEKARAAVLAEAAFLEARRKAAEEAKFRTWTSTTGSSIEAKFVSYASGKVTLEKRDGKRLTVDLSKLSQDDRDWLENERRERSR